MKEIPGTNFNEKRRFALEKKKTQNESQPNRVIAPLDFNPHLPQISSVLNKHHKSMIFRKPDLKKVFPEPPMAALRQPPNLRRMLCRSYLYSIKRGDRLQRSSQKNPETFRDTSLPAFE